MDTPPVYFNNLAIAGCKTRKHLGLLLDERLAFDLHVEEMSLRDNKDIGLITRLCRHVPRNYLLTIYKTFVRRHLYYGDVIYDYPENAYFMQKLESVQLQIELEFVELAVFEVRLGTSCILKLSR